MVVEFFFIMYIQPWNFFENLFPPTAERAGKKYELLYQNSIRKYEDDLEY